MSGFDALTKKISEINLVTRFGRVSRVTSGFIEAEGLSVAARIGDLVTIDTGSDALLDGEIVALSSDQAVIMTYGMEQAPAIGDLVALNGPGRFEPGRRRPFGQRLNTGLAVFDTMLPLVRGQRIGVFAGSGVGKTTLLGTLARGIEADCVVIGLIGERGREVMEFVTRVLGPEGMEKAVVVAATSDQSPLVKRRAAWTATAVAEVMRDAGKNVLLILDSLTRFAEAHREIALTSGETPSLRAYPPSTANFIAALTERSGTGVEGQGDITAIYSVLVAGSDMDEPVADITRGVLDGHIILDREIAERGRFPAVDVRRSVSRSLPDAASAEENGVLHAARELLATYEASAALIQTGLYTAGSDPVLDAAIKVWPELDRFFAKSGMPNAEASFNGLRGVLGIEPPKPVEPEQKAPVVLPVIVSGSEPDRV